MTTYRSITWMLTIILSGIMLTSCDVDNSDSGSEENRKMIVNTRWQLTEVLDKNNVWQPKNLFFDLDIPYLQFYANNRYEISIYNFDGHKGTNTFRGGFNWDINTINFTGDPYSGIIISLSIHYMNSDQLEGLLTLWGEEDVTDHPYVNGVSFTPNSKQYTLRMKRVNQ